LSIESSVGFHPQDLEPFEASTHDIDPNLLSVVRRHRDLRRLLASLAVSQIGDWCYNIALLVTVYSTSHSGLLLAATTVARILPDFVAGPLGGVLTDRYDRRGLMIASDVVRAVLMALFAATVAWRLPMTLFPVLAFAASFAGAPYRTSVGATIPRIVTAEQLPAANSAKTLTTEASVVLGPLLAALFVVLGSSTAAFLVNGVSFVLAGLLLLRISPSAFVPPRSGLAETLVGDLRAGLAALRDHPTTWPMAGADILATGIYGLLTVLLLLFSREATGGDAGYGILLTASGVGGVLGGASTTRLMRALAARTLLTWGLLALLASLTVMAALASRSWFLLALPAVALYSAAAVAVEIQADTVLQQTIPEGLFGRVYGFIVPSCYAVQALGAGVAAALTELLGLSGAFACGALLVAAYIGWTVRRYALGRHLPPMPRHLP
jgi:predicted MFS family arabinose efflux permease